MKKMTYYFLLFLFFLVLATFLLIGPRQVQATIIVGSWEFDDLAFADNASQLESGLIDYRFGGSTLNDVLTGYSPALGIVNIGLTIGTDYYANLFQLDFTDYIAINQMGADIVFFEARFSSDSYEIAVHEVGGSLSAFNYFRFDSFTDISESGPGGSSLYALEIDLSDFGLATGALVDAIQFRAADSYPHPTANPSGLPEGDPVMAGILNGTTPVPEPSTLFLFFTTLIGLVGIKKKFKA